ncbi:MULTISPECIES: N-acetylneuraminate synthase family protein [Aeromonas]|uniref:N-acetylneuraminate synthase family protein n=1 Tax=Aeromonas TaxID=642 RepID=UPI000D0DC160|nr:MULTISPECIES: N-acetylneuraminate synthase family protein [Aeromonas]AVP82674.1 acetylneuraminic acid synthetase [Aeromonas hydrophila]EIS3739880.1 N-acetylneuraminate synthase family protein [Aeromonas hydrophila]ELA9380637.1 N-acetylneuraminate synthase family protein [Aeromonas hydrophila]
MIIDRNVTRYVVFSDETIMHALQKMSLNKSGIVFVLTQNGVLEGVMTDGDLRRWLLEETNFDLSLPVAIVSNHNFTSADIESPHESISALFSSRIKYLPLLDRQHRLMAVATQHNQPIQIDNFVIAEESPTFIIAEIGNNHNGDIVLAKKLVDLAVASGANCAKFQMRHLASMYRQNTPQKTAGEDLGSEYTLQLLERFQLTTKELIEVFDYCKEKGIIPLCTPWDATSLDELENYGMPAYKVASADLTNHEFLEKLILTRKPLICSTGMSSEQEIKNAIALFQRNGTQFIILHCNSTYPAPFKDINLKYISRLQELIQSGHVGYSGHERGMSVAMAAVSLGAKVIEKHFTLDRNMEGNDHRVSLLPDEFTMMVQGIREIELAMGHRKAREVTQGEMMNREVLGKSLICTRDLKIGEIITSNAVDIRSPGKGLPPYEKNKLIGMVARRDIAVGDFFYPSDLNEKTTHARQYSFNRPFGIPVRYHDLKDMLGKTNLDLVEFHLSYKDLDLDPADYLASEGYDLDVIVHSPELFYGDHIMDLCSEDKIYREHSIKELQRVIDKTRQIASYFHRATKPLIIINAGGFTLDSFMPRSEREVKYKLIAEAIKKLDSQGVEIIPQTMPPYPWHFGGQRYHNLFMEADEISDFCERQGMRVCLDISHSKLACNLNKDSFARFIRQIAPYTAHLHLVDAKDVDGEGLQIGEGEIDFDEVSELLKQHAPTASFIPEIWQGHKNNGEGFWIALERLEQFKL